MWARIAILLVAAFAVLCAPAEALVTLNRGNGAEIKSLDPHFISTVAESTVLGDLLMGLITLDAAARPIPRRCHRLGNVAGREDLDVSHPPASVV